MGTHSAMILTESPVSRAVARALAPDSGQVLSVQQRRYGSAVPFVSCALVVHGRQFMSGAVASVLRTLSTIGSTVLAETGEDDDIYGPSFAGLCALNYRMGVGLA